MPPLPRDSQLPKKLRFHARAVVAIILAIAVIVLSLIVAKPWSNQGSQLTFTSEKTAMDRLKYEAAEHVETNYQYYVYMGIAFEEVVFRSRKPILGMSADDLRTLRREHEEGLVSSGNASGIPKIDYYHAAGLQFLTRANDEYGDGGVTKQELKLLTRHYDAATTKANSLVDSMMREWDEVKSAEETTTIVRSEEEREYYATVNLFVEENQQRYLGFQYRVLPEGLRSAGGFVVFGADDYAVSTIMYEDDRDEQMMWLEKIHRDVPTGNILSYKVLDVLTFPKLPYSVWIQQSCHNISAPEEHGVIAMLELFEDTGEVVIYQVWQADVSKEAFIPLSVDEVNCVVDALGYEP